MPYISQEYTDCSIYVYPTVKAAERGVTAGGSGFLVDYPSENHPELRYVYAVTNAHVIEKGATVVRLNTRTGRHQAIPLSARNWLFPPAPTENSYCDDIAIAFLGILPEHYQAQAIASEKILTQDMVSRNLVGLGDDVFMVGRFIGHDGKERNTPAVRFGNIALLPNPIEPISQLPDRAYDQESFIVEMRSISGFSGAPVFVYDSFADLPSQPRSEAGYGATFLVDGRSSSFLFLLGINWGHLEAKEYLVHSSMAGVVPGWRLIDLLNSEEAIMQRKQKDKEVQIEKTERGGAVLDYADEENDEGDVFTEDDFEQALRKVARRDEKNEEK